MAAPPKPPVKQSSFSSMFSKKKKEEIPYDQEKYGEVNERFINGCQGNMIEAQKRWIATIDWRIEEKIDDLLSEPQPHFHDIKAQYPHYYHGRSRNGNYMYYERPGLASIRPMLKNKHLTIPATVRHYLFTTEWLWNHLDPRNDGRLISVYDCTGIKVSDLAGDVFKLMKAMMKVMQSHYPERSAKMLIINAPSYFTTLWSMISPMIDPVTKTKISILGNKFHKELFEVVDPKNVPIEFGGEDETPFGSSAEEIALRKFADECNGGPGASYDVSREKLLRVHLETPDTPVENALMVINESAPKTLPVGAAEEPVPVSVKTPESIAPVAAPLKVEDTSSSAPGITTVEVLKVKEVPSETTTVEASKTEDTPSPAPETTTVEAPKAEEAPSPAPETD